MTHDLTFCDSANSVFALMNLQQQHNYAIIFNGLLPCTSVIKSMSDK